MRAMIAAVMLAVAGLAIASMPGATAEKSCAFDCSDNRECANDEACLGDCWCDYGTCLPN